MALQNSNIVNMDKFLVDEYFIPNYQREYSWEELELKDFWNDLMLVVKEDIDHFFGQIVIHSDTGSEPKRKYIIDGQQRTITSVIFMRVLYDFFHKIYKEYEDEDANDTCSDIISKHIGRYTETKNELHLTLGELDRDYFRDNIQNRKNKPNFDVKEKKRSHERLRKAFMQLYLEVEAYVGGFSTGKDKLTALTALYSAFTKRFNVLYVEATELGEAFMIFETLNARGKDLETSDLLKNYIFSKYPEDVNDAIKKWNYMINSLDQSDPTKYIRHFWNSAYTFARERELYRKINNNIVTPRDSKEFLDKLSENAKYYNAMTSPEDATAFEDESLRKILVALKTLKASSFYPIILAMKLAITDFSEKDIATVAKQIEVLFFRNFTISKKSSSGTEVFFANVAKEIYDGDLNDVNSIVVKISTEIVSDKEFSDAFDIWKGNKSSKEVIRYILRKVHNNIDTSMELNIDNSEVHIEHIMPEDYSNWSIEEEMHEEYLWRLGNLALLSGSINKSISNKPFNDKKSRYGDSKIEPNKELTTLSEWGAKEIEDRQKKLREYALEIWAKA